MMMKLFMMTMLWMITVTEHANYNARARTHECALCLVNLGQVVLEGCQDGSVVIDEHFRCVARTTAARTDVMR